MTVQIFLRLASLTKFSAKSIPVEHQSPESTLVLVVSVVPDHLINLFETSIKRSFKYKRVSKILMNMLVSVVRLVPVMYDCWVLFKIK
jgi:hypothetical protein